MTDQTTSLLPTVTRQWFATIQDETAHALTGQTDVLEQLMLALLCREHALLEGPAGSARFSAVEALGNCFGLPVRRLRCTPDLELSDVVGHGVWSDLWNASLLVVDNIDRLTPKLGSVVQQAMQERRVPGDPEPRQLPDPFVVFATRPRTEDPAHPDPADSFHDRFLFQLKVPYPSYCDEYAVAAAKSGATPEPAHQRFDKTELAAWQSLVRQIEAPPSVIHYAVRLARATRVHEGENPDFIYEWVQQGAGPRAAHFLVLAAKARATLFGRPAAAHDDVQALSYPVLRHRIVTNRNARTNGIDSDRVIRRLLEEVPSHVAGDDTIPQPGVAFTFHDWVPNEPGI